MLTNTYLILQMRVFICIWTNHSIIIKYSHHSQKMAWHCKYSQALITFIRHLQHLCDIFLRFICSIGKQSQCIGNILVRRGRGMTENNILCICNLGANSQRHSKNHIANIFTYVWGQHYYSNQLKKICCSRCGAQLV